MEDNLIIPKHIAIIMDGNGKWAKSKSLPKNLGHKKGAEMALEIAKSCKKLGVNYLTLYAFSSENWGRPKQEVDYLFDLFQNHLQSNVNKLIQEDVKIVFIGNRDKISKDIRSMMNEAEEKSKANSFTLIIAFSYGSRDDIRSAAFNFAQDVIANNHDLSKLDRDYFDRFISTSKFPEPDLLIRTGEEVRLSNFLLWELSYSELYFTKILWPDFTENDLKQAILDFSQRERRYGK